MFKQTFLTVCAACLILMLTSGSIEASTLNAERAIIVDCLLPGKVRQLGINRTYISRKQPAKISGDECEVRGGDYVKFDRANIATSLNVWQQSASQGDAKAQYYVGEIFEKGMGQEPDFELAVMWYQRAVKQGYQPAQMSLGRLYELGRGVEKDLVKAMNLYRQASGLEDDEIAYASVFEEIKARDELRISELEAELNAEKRKLKSLTTRSQVLNSDLQRSQEAVKLLKQEIQSLEQKLKDANQQQATSIQASIDSKQSELVGETARNERLLEQLKQTQIRLESANKKLLALTPTGTPTLALKWPQFELREGVNVSEVPAGSTVNVVGAIETFSNLKGFKINGEDYQLDANGLFLKSLDVGSKTVELSIEMIDQTGQSIFAKLAVEPSDDVNVVLKGAGSLTRPKFEFGTYHALVIGNNNYDFNKGWDPLDTAVSDAEAIAKVLQEQYGFEVRLELNADRDTMLTALEEMRKKLNANDNLLVYYAGHGIVDPENDQGYWVPVDGSSDSAVRWVSNASITDQIRAMTARNVMVIADSCYSGSLMRSGIVTLRSGLSAEKKALRLDDDVKQLTRVALSSGGMQPVVDSLENSPHSVFANALLSVLNDNTDLLDADSLATQVAHTVAVATKDNVRQVPRYAPLAAGGHQGGEFYFAPLKLIVD